MTLNTGPAETGPAVVDRAAGRFAPSPTGDLHLGNLRTALIAWLAARSTGRRFLLRFEDLDTSSIREEFYRTQADDLAALGLAWDEPPVNQSDRRDRYTAALDRLAEADLLFNCYCSRREIREATQAPNGPYNPRVYPGTCRHLTAVERAEREAAGRPPALRLRGDLVRYEFDDLVAGAASGEVDDVVVQRNDGTPAYNLAVVVDDHEQGIDQVVRADDLVSSTPSQLHIATLLGYGVPEFWHVPLVLGPEGKRLAKRDGAVTLADRRELGESAADVLSILAVSCALAEPGEPVTAEGLIPRFAERSPTDLATIPQALEI